MQVTNIVLESTGNIKTVSIPVNIYNRLQHSVSFFTDPHFSRDGVVIAQVFGFTGGFLDEWNNNVYCRVQRIACRLKEQARIRHSFEKCGLNAILLADSLRCVCRGLILIGARRGWRAGRYFLKFAESPGNHLGRPGIGLI